MTDLVRAVSYRYLISLAGLLLASSVQAENLLEVLDLALESDPTWRAALYDRDSAHESRPQALSQLLPSIGLNADATRVNRDVKKSPVSSDQDEIFTRKAASVDLVQPLYDRASWIGLTQSDFTIAGADADYSASEQDLIIRTAEAYFNVLSAQDTLTFRKADRKAIARQLDQAKQRFEVGLIAITDVDESQARFDQARADEIGAANEVEDAREALREIIGVRLYEIAILGEEMPLLRPDPNNIDAWSDEAQQNNRSIVAARNSTQVARENIEVQRSDHYPVVDLVGSESYFDSTGGQGTRTQTGQIGVQLNLQIYTGGATVSRTRAATFDYESAQENLDALRRSVDRQARDAFRGVISSISQVQALKATTVSAASSLEATEAGYEVGTRTIIDVLDQQQRYFFALKDYADTRYNYILNGLSLKQAVGSLGRDDLEEVNAWLTYEKPQYPGQ